MNLSIDQKRVTISILNEASKQLDLDKSKEFIFLVEIVTELKASIKEDEKQLEIEKNTTD